MIYVVDELMRNVRIALDSNNVSAPLIAENDIDTLSMDEIIRSKLLEGVRRVHCEAPAYLLDIGHHFGDSVYWSGKGSGWTLLPDDFMRLVMFRMSDWERTVYTAISTDDPEYELQSCRVKALRGTSQKPVCAIAVRPEGRVLEFYSCKSEDAYITQGVYIPYPYIDDDGGVDISERCLTAIIYMVAGLTCTAIGETEKSNILFELSKNALI